MPDDGYYGFVTVMQAVFGFMSVLWVQLAPVLAFVWTETLRIGPVTASGMTPGVCGVLSLKARHPGTPFWRQWLYRLVFLLVNVTYAVWILGTDAAVWIQLLPSASSTTKSMGATTMVLVLVLATLMLGVLVWFRGWAFYVSISLLALAVYVDWWLDWGDWLMTAFFAAVLVIVQLLAHLRVEKALKNKLGVV